ncbi:MAG TPA: hypothetical protein VKU89_10335 [Solirubrobacteraceae bacterium]|nr:hypothetical protein [Solirubrobacteraceae bacterium]
MDQQAQHRREGGDCAALTPSIEERREIIAGAGAFLSAAEALSTPERCNGAHIAAHLE